MITSTQAQLRLHIVERAYDDIQALIRMMDQKAFVAIVAVGALNGAYYTAVKSSGILSENAHVHEYTLLALSLAFVIATASVIFHAFGAMRPRHAVFDVQDSRLPLHPQHLSQALSLQIDAYVARLNTLDEQDFLPVYAREIMAVSSVYLRKQNAIKWTYLSLQAAILLWALAICVILTKWLC